mgnify:CR=1 FL=1
MKLYEIVDVPWPCNPHHSMSHKMHTTHTTHMLLHCFDMVFCGVAGVEQLQPSLAINKPRAGTNSILALPLTSGKEAQILPLVCKKRVQQGYTSSVSPEGQDDSHRVVACRCRPIC